MSDIIYIFIGGAYSEDYWTQFTPPDEEQWESWSCGELVIVKVKDLIAYQRNNSFIKTNDAPEWVELKRL